MNCKQNTPLKLDFYLPVAGWIGCVLVVVIFGVDGVVVDADCVVVVVFVVVDNVDGAIVVVSCVVAAVVGAAFYQIMLISKRQINLM